MKKSVLLIGMGIAVVILVVAVLAIWFFFTNSVSIQMATASNCSNCHGDQDRLKSLSDRWERLYVDPAQFVQEAHGGLACTVCHGGDPTKDSPQEACLDGKAAKDPAAPQIVEKTCGNCHSEITARHVKSIHSSLDGIRLSLIDTIGEKEGMFQFQATCNDCHATCSGCHMEEPDRRNLLWPRAASHHFEARSESKNCVACHTGMGDTFFGEKGNPKHAPSLMAQAGMQCVDCHGDKDVHGTGVKTSFSMQSPKPNCTDCHSQPSRRVTGSKNTVAAPQYALDTPAHQIHDDNAISCEACHTQWYPSCWNCHNGRTDKTVDSLFLAVSPLTKKIQPAAHSPATSTSGNQPPPQTRGGWAIKTRHSWGASQTCETCHTNLDVFISAVERQAPFVGYWSSKHANAAFVDEKLTRMLVIDLNKLKQDAHKDTTCEDCHKSLADDVCADCHVKSVKTGKTFLKADADWSRTDYITVRTTLENAADAIRQAKASGMRVETWERDWQNLKDSYLQSSNDFHGQPGQAQVAMKTARTSSQAFLRSIQETVQAQQNQNRGLQVGLLFGTGTVGAVVLGFVLNRKHKK